MISKRKIQNTVVSYWSTEDECFVAESSLIPHVVTGIGDTEIHAKNNFNTALDDVYDEISSDNLSGYKAGRPAKGYVAFNANISPTSKERLAQMSGLLEISQGETVDYLVFYRDCKQLEENPMPDHLSNMHKSILDAISALDAKVDRLPQKVQQQINLSPLELQKIGAEAQKTSTSTQTQVIHINHLLKAKQL